MPVTRRLDHVSATATVSALDTGQGPLVVLLHGIPSSARLWEAVMWPLAAGGLRVVAPDLPGYGRTRVATRRDHSLAAAADLLARWLDALGAGPAWVVGHDAGGAVAQLLAVDHPEAVARLTLVNSIVDGSWPAPRARIAGVAARLGLYRVGARLRLVPNPYVRRELRRGFADPAHAADADMDGVFWEDKLADAAGRRAFEHHLAALDPVDTAHVAQLLGELAVPCQLVWGMADPFQTWEVAGRRLQELLPEPAVTQLTGCGHLVPLECPDRLVAALEDWRGGATW